MRPKSPVLNQYVFVPVKLNSGTDEEILSIPAAQPNRVLREFKEYRPYADIEKFRREMGKYWDAKEVKRLERYITLNLGAAEIRQLRLCRLEGFAPRPRHDGRWFVVLCQ
jgi:hypothetical protein